MNIKTAHVAALLAFVPALVSDLSFSYNEVGSDVVVTYSGILDAPQMESFPGWDGAGVGSSGDGDGYIGIDVMDLADIGAGNQSVELHAGTGISAGANSVDPLETSSGWDWITEAAGAELTYPEFGGGFRVPGTSLAPTYVAGGSWPSDQESTDSNNAFEPPGLNVGVDPIIDPIIDSIVGSLPSEAITIQVDDETSRSVSVPDGGATIALLGLSVACLAMLGCRREA